MYRGHQKKCLPSKQDKIFIAENAFVHCDNKNNGGSLTPSVDFQLTLAGRNILTAGVIMYE